MAEKQKIKREKKRNETWLNRNYKQLAACAIPAMPYQVHDTTGDAMLRYLRKGLRREKHVRNAFGQPLWQPERKCQHVEDKRPMHNLFAKKKRGAGGRSQEEERAQRKRQFGPVADS